MRDNAPHCDDCAALEPVVKDTARRVQQLEAAQERVREAFVINDLGLPDYDGHRSSHKRMSEEAKVLEGYKRDATKKIVGLILAGLLTLSSLGLIEWIKIKLG